MRVLVVTPKIMDESLSATTRTAVLGALAGRADVTLVARFRRTSRATSPLGVKVTPIAAPRVPGVSMLWFHLAAGLAAARSVRRERPDVLLIEPSAVPAALLARALTSGPFPPVHLDLRTLPITTRGLRARLDRVFTAATLKASSRICSGYSAISPGAADWLAERTHADRSGINVWGTGVDPALFDPDGHPAPGPEVRPVRLLYHGAVYASRGLDSLIEAVGMLSPAEAADIRLTILGSGPDVEALSALVAKLGVSGSVRMLDAVPPADVPTLIAEHHAGILPLPDLECWRTSSPTKLLEYVAMAKPVVVTDIDAHRAVLDSEPSAVWAGAGSASDLAAGIRDLAGRLPELTAAAREVRDRLAEAHSWRRQADLLHGALASLATDAAPAAATDRVSRSLPRLLLRLALAGIALATLAWLLYLASFELAFPRQEPVDWVPPAREGTATPFAANLQRALDDYSDSQGGIALQASVITSDGAEWHGVAGYSDIARRVPATFDDHFVIGSVTKTMMASVAMREVDAGRLDIDVPISQWEPTVPNADRITLRMVMDHMSGIRSYNRNRWFRWFSHRLPWKRWEPRELVEVVVDDPPAQEPDAVHNYSNTNYVILGLVLEKVTGRTAAELLYDEITGPLGMRDTFLVDIPAGEKMARGYDEYDIGGRRRDVTLLVPETVSAGYTSAGVISTSRDVARFLHALFRGSVVSSESLGAMTQTKPASSPSNPYQLGYGLGLVEWQSHGSVWWGHVGASPGYSSVAMYSPQSGTTFVVLANLSSVDRVDLFGKMQEAVEAR